MVLFCILLNEAGHLFMYVRDIRTFFSVNYPSDPSFISIDFLFPYWFVGTFYIKEINALWYQFQTFSHSLLYIL